MTGPRKPLWLQEEGPGDGDVKPCRCAESRGQVGREAAEAGWHSLLAVRTSLHRSELGRMEVWRRGCRTPSQSTSHLERQLFWAPSCRTEQGVPTAMEEKVLEGKEQRGCQAEASQSWETDGCCGQATSICSLL